MATATGNSPERQAQPVARGDCAIVRSLAGRNLLFSEADQAIFEIDGATAERWHSIERAADRRAFLDELLPANATSRPTPQEPIRLRASSATAAKARPPLVVDVAGVPLRLQISHELLDEVSAVFGHLHSSEPAVGDAICARTDGNAIELLAPGQPPQRCSQEEFIPLLKAALIEVALRNGRYEMAFHGAALASGDEVFLLLGSPGAGKTTLGIALAQSGFEVVADDVVLMNGQSMIRGIQFPFAAKSTSWPFMDSHWPGIVAGPIHRRPDDKLVRYIFQPFAPPRPRKITRIVILDRRARAKTHIEEADPVEVLTKLVAEGDSRDHRLSTAGFSALADALGAASCCRLTYDDAVDAAAALGALRG